MPTFKGQVSEEEIFQLIAFIRSLKTGQTPKRVESYPPPASTPPINTKDKSTHEHACFRSAGRCRSRRRNRRTNYLNASYSVTSWLLTTDHKRIAILYLLPITLMFFIGGLAISISRLSLMTPEGGLVDADTYNKLFTMHGVIMVFFFLVPVIPSRAGKFLPADDDRRQGPGLSANQSAQLVSVHARRGLGRGGRAGRRRRYGLDLLHALQLRIVRITTWS